MRKALFSAHNAIKVETCGATEWVRGNDAALVERFTPMVRSQSVVVDFSAVERIDAAGLAALVLLYRTSRDSGHTFAIANPARRVEEILTVVGLDGVLVTGWGEAQPVFDLSIEPGLERDAA